jgi:CBS domain containing-hemolysin-like protein
VSTSAALVLSLVLLLLNGFFVAAEFALVAAKRHRLQPHLGNGALRTRAAKAALDGGRQLSLMLAGAQLGITLCSLGLGALAKPALTDLLKPALHAIGLPAQFSYVAAFLLALAVVVFLHMVIGEMAPKSWAISHPETSALLLALPFRAFAFAVRPILQALNGIANATLRAVRVRPAGELADAHGPAELMLLLDTSARHGTLPDAEQRMLSAMLALSNTTVESVMIPAERIVAVAGELSAPMVEQAARRSGRSRLAVTDATGIAGFVHVRDALKATTYGIHATASDLVTPPYVLGPRQTVMSAIRGMREHRAQLALVASGGAPVGLVALEDLLEQVIGEFHDETDTSHVEKGKPG